MRLELRLSHQPKAVLQRAAMLKGCSLSTFVIASAVDEAGRITACLSTIRLTAEESRAFAEALLNPREPTRRLRAAARRYLATIGD